MNSRDVTYLDDIEFSSGTRFQQQPFYQQQEQQAPRRESFLPPQQHHMMIPPPQQQAPKITCLDFAAHVESCPLCSKHYSTDTRYHWLAILILCILLVLFVKKVLDQ